MVRVVLRELTSMSSLEKESHPASHWLDKEVSLFPNAYITAPSDTKTVYDVIMCIRNGEWRKETEEIRKASDINKKHATNLKVQKMPVVKFSGSFISSNANGLIKHSGLLCLDFDNLGDNLNKMRSNLSKDPFALIYFISVGGNGIKLIVRINASTADEHKRCFQAAYNHFIKDVPDGGRLDDKPSNVSSNCFVSYDPNVWVSDRPCSVFQPIPNEEHSTLNTSKQNQQITEEIRDSVDLSDKEEREEVISVESTASKDSTDLHRNKQKRKKAEAYLSSMKDEDQLHIRKLYEQFIQNRRAVRGERYSFLLTTIPAIFQVFSIEKIVELLLLHYDEQTGIWRTSRAEHEKEIVQMLQDYSTNDYPAQLSANEQLYYNCLDDEYQKAAFRICRGLSNAKDANGFFFMSFNNMGSRINLNRKAGEAVLQELCANNIIEQTQRGIARSKGQHGKATKWKWLLNK